MKLVISGRFGKREKLFDDLDDEMCDVEDLVIWSKGREFKLVEIENKECKDWSFLGFKRGFEVKSVNWVDRKKRELIEWLIRR
jgi:hypothetical protein